MPRRDKLTPERFETIVRAIREGNTYRAAAGLAGVTESTLYNWLERGRKARSGKYLEFLEAVKKAEAEAEARHVRIVERAAAKNWTAAAWWLERRRPDDWSLKQRVEHSGRIDVRQVIRIGDQEVEF